MNIRSLLARPRVAAARADIIARDHEIFAEQLRLAAIPAPTSGEGPRGEYVRTRFGQIGLKGVARDEVGNIVGCLHASGKADRPRLLVVAHLDTVFPADTAVEIRTIGERVYAPGIADNSRGLAGLIAIAAAMVRAELVPERPIWFVASVGEEGAGDLRGVKHLFSSLAPERVHALIALDGSGVRRIVHRALGARRLRVTLRGPGGHSWSDWGNANPVHALGLIISRLRDIPLDPAGSASLTAARIGGGSSVNSIPEQAWFELDLRSESRETLERLAQTVRGIVDRSITEENSTRRGGSPPLEVEIEPIGDRPAGSIPTAHPLVEAAAAATRAVGARPDFASSSTDANVPLALGVPAITIGVGGESGGIHTTGEWYSNEGGARGLDRALLTVLAADSCLARSAATGSD